MITGNAVKIKAAAAAFVGWEDVVRPTRQLLLTTRQMAMGTLHWPVFAELDRRLYSGYETFRLSTSCG